MTPNEAQSCFELGVGYAGFLAAASDHVYGKFLQSAGSLGLNLPFAGKDEAHRRLLAEPSYLPELLGTSGGMDRVLLFFLGVQATAFLIEAKKKNPIIDSQQSAFLNLFDELNLDRKIGADYLSLLSGAGADLISALLSQGFQVFELRLFENLRGKYVGGYKPGTASPKV